MKSDVKDKILESSSGESGSEDDDEAWKLTNEVEKEFFKTLSHIKSKDPKIYQRDVQFFKDVTIPEQNPKEKSKSTPLTLREYERKIVTEKGGELSDEEISPKRIEEVSYVEEQRALKNSLKNLLQSDSEYESEAEWGGLFKKRQKTRPEQEKDEEDYKEWLKGQKSEAPDEEVKKEMKPLRDFWTNPDLNQEDQFLRDYILNKRFLDADDSGVDIDKLQDESEVEDSEDQLDKDCSHRFEEPDQEYIKRYPRVMEHSVRRKDDSRRRKREEIKERKQKEKEKKKSDIRQKQKLKKKEIEERLEELKKLTGNEKLAFENVLDKDFDMDEHDKAMQKLFSEEFYLQDDPNFNLNDHPDEEDDWNDGDEETYVKEEADEPHCEDPDFNMDCDYDPAVESLRQKTSRSRRRKDKHRRTTVSEAVKREKPVFDPAMHKSYQEYLDQYYAIDCEDFIGDLPCRFKYRRTVPNSYGLTIEEIMAADPKELDRWCSIKRVTQLKPAHKEKGDAMSFMRRAKNEELKRKILPSLFKNSEEERPATSENDVSKHDDKNKIDNVNVENNVTTKNKNNNDHVKTDLRKKRKLVASEMIVAPNKRRKVAPEQRKSPKISKSNENAKNKKKVNLKNFKNAPKQSKSSKISKNVENSKNKNEVNVKNSNEKSSLLSMSDARLQAYGIKPKQFRNKLKYNNLDSNKNKSGNKSGSSIKKLKRNGTKVNLTGSGKNESPSTTISKKKKNMQSKLTKKNANGWTVSNAPKTNHASTK